MVDCWMRLYGLFVYVNILYMFTNILNQSAAIFKVRLLQ